MSPISDKSLFVYLNLDQLIQFVEIDLTTAIVCKLQTKLFALISIEFIVVESRRKNEKKLKLKSNSNNKSMAQEVVLSSEAYLFLLKSVLMLSNGIPEHYSSRAIAACHSFMHITSARDPTVTF